MAVALPPLWLALVIEAAVDLCDIRNELKQLAVGFDALLVHPHDAPVMLRCATAVKNMAGAIEAQLALRVADCGTWKRSGDKSAAHHIARETGTTVGGAKDLLDTARRLEDLPAVDAAVRAGELSDKQASAVASGASVNPGAEQALLEAAKSMSVPELRDEAARRRAEVEDAEIRRQKIHARRNLRHWTDAEGMGHLHLADNPEVIARVWAEVTPVADRRFREARASGDHEPAGAYLADALVEVVTRPATDDDSRRRYDNAKVIARIDLPWLLGEPVGEGEVCEIVGYGPVARSTVLDLIDGGAFLAAVLTKGEAVLGVAHLGRKPRRIQQTALQWLFPTCSVQGCSAPACHSEVDHVDDWAVTHRTLLERLRPMCDHHHDMKTRHNWMLVEGPGKQPLVPPEDPRHPKWRRSAG